MAGCLVAFLALLEFAYPEELLGAVESTSFQTEAQVFKQEELIVDILSLNFDEKKKTISGEISANLPNETDILLHLRSEKPNAAGKGITLLLDYKAKVIDEKIQLNNVPIYEFSDIPQENTSYFLSLDIPINQEINEGWLESRYDNNYLNLNIRDEGYERNASLEVADTITIAQGYSSDEVIKMTEERVLQEKEQKQKELQTKKRML